MLLIKTKLGKSVIHGIGVFAAERIVAGTKIGEFLEGFDLSFENVDELPLKAQTFLYTYAYKENGIYYLNIDNMRYFNHSLTPNTVSNGICDFALKTIEVGEELTCNYYDFDEDAHRKLLHS